MSTQAESSEPSIRVLKLSLDGDAASSKFPPYALGKKGPSWFIGFATPFGDRRIREHDCLNVVYAHDPATLPPSSPPRFVFKKAPGTDKRLETLLHPVEGGPVLRLTGRMFDDVFPGEYPEVEVLLSKTEIMHACARCGKWEASKMPRFKACAACKARSYCSEKCQKADWTKELHKGDCKLLREGKEWEVEQRRSLHDNRWTINRIMHGVNEPLRFLDSDDESDDPDFFNYGFDPDENYM